MKKYKNVGSPVGFIINGKTIDFQNGQVLVESDDFKEKITDAVSKIVDVVAVPVTVAAPVEKKKKYNEKDLLALTKSEQEKILSSLGFKAGLKTEKERVKKILELSK